MFDYDLSKVACIVWTNELFDTCIFPSCVFYVGILSKLLEQRLHTQQTFKYIISL